MPYDDTKQQDDDEVELRKSLATGASRANGADVQAGAAASILCYCIASILMTVVNKFVVSGQNFSMNFLMLCMQSFVGVSCVAISKSLGIISFRKFDGQDAKNWFPISFMLVCVIYTGSKSLQYLSIPVYTIFKNLTIILIAQGEVIWFGGRISGLTYISFFFMIFSSVIAAWSDVRGAMSQAAPSGAGISLSYESYELVTGAVRNINIGYLWMAVNCLTSAAYVLTMRKRIKLTGFSDWDTMFYNNLLSIPVLAIFSCIAEDWGTENLTRNFPPETRNVLFFAIAFSGAAAVGISYTTAWCIRVTSSTTYSMVGALNKLPVAASGMIFFGDLVTFGSVSAIAVGFFAGVLYAVAKSNQKRDEVARAGNTIPLTNVRR